MPHAAVNDSKHTERVNVSLTEREMLDASRLADQEGRAVSEFIRVTLRTAMYGQVSRLSSNSEPNRSAE